MNCANHSYVRWNMKCQGHWNCSEDSAAWILKPCEAELKNVSVKSICENSANVRWKRLGLSVNRKLIISKTLVHIMRFKKISACLMNYPHGLCHYPSTHVCLCTCMCVPMTCVCLCTIEHNSKPPIEMRIKPLENSRKATKPLEFDGEAEQCGLKHSFGEKNNELMTSPQSCDGQQTSRFT